MENYLTQITNYLLAQSWQIAVLVAVIAAATVALKNRSAHVRYLLWLIVLAKCLVPPLLTIPLAVLPQQRYAEPVPISSSQMPTVTFETVDAIAAEVPASPATPVITAPTLTATGKPARLTILQWLVFGWIAGVAVFLLFAVVKALRTNRWLRRDRKPLPAELQSGIKNLFPDVSDIKAFPKVWLVDGIGQPFVWGLLRGGIYLPADFVKVDSAEHRRGVLGHELSHILRFDAAVNILQIIAQAIFWFHPFVWWANKRIRAEREKCCDEMAIARLGARVKDYSIAIVNTLVVEHESTRPVPSLAVAGPVKNIEERIKTIMKPGKKFYKRPSLVAAIVIVLVVLITAPTAVVLTARAEITGTVEAEQGANKLGQLEYIDHLSTDEYLARCTSVELSPDGRHLYATAYGSRSLVLFSRDEATGYITHLKTIPLKGAFATRVSPDGRYVVCSDVRGGSEYYAGSNSMSLFERDQLTGNLTLLDSVKHDENGIESLDCVVDVSFSPDSQYVYVVARRSAAVTAFKIIDEKKLAFVQCNKGRNQCFDGARGITISPDGKYFYVASTQADTLTVLQRNAETGKINLKQVIRNEQGDVHGLQGVWDVTCSPDGKFVYTNARGKHDAICTFERKSDGTLSLVQEVHGNEGQIGMDGGSRLRVSPDGKHLYALGMNSDSIVVFQRNRKTGKLTHIQTHSCKKIGKHCFPADLGISPDGEYVYVGGEGIGLNGIILLKRLTGTKMGTAKSLYKAACSGDMGQVQSLVESGGGINEKGAGGYTALHWAARENHKKASELLLYAGADVNARTGVRGWTPLHVAVLQSNKEVAESLIAKGADLDAENPNNSLTPLMVTQKTGDLDFAEFLIDNGANVNGKSQHGSTPLQKAAVAGDTAFADLFIKKGANIEETTDSGWTPLFFAIRTHELEMIRLLISKGADVNAKNRWGQTLMDGAKMMNFTDIVELLRKHGAKE